MIYIYHITLCFIMNHDYITRTIIKTCLIYEPWAHGEAHLEFNKAFLQTLSYLYDKIIFLGDKNHIQYLNKIKYKTEILLYPCNITDYHTLKGKVLSVFREVLNIKKIKKMSQGADIYFSYGAAHSMLIAERFLKNKKVFYIQHGQIETITRKQHIYNINYYLPMALNNLPANHYIIVLGDFIKKNLESAIPKLIGKIIAIDHPFIKTNIVINKTGFNKIKIGTIGVGTKDKGIEQLNEISLFIKKNNLDIQVNHIGRIFDDVILDKKMICCPFSSNKLIPRNDFINKIAELDYILFLYPQNSYKFTASGAIFDAFLLGKPIIALQNDYFNYLFEKAGSVGFLLDNIESLKQKLLELPNPNTDFYKEMSKLSCKALEVFSPEKIAEELRPYLGGVC